MVLYVMRVNCGKCWSQIKSINLYVSLFSKYWAFRLHVAFESCSERKEMTHWKQAVNIRANFRICSWDFAVRGISHYRGCRDEDWDGADDCVFTDQWSYD